MNKRKKKKKDEEKDEEERGVRKGEESNKLVFCVCIFVYF